MSAIVRPINTSARRRGSQASLPAPSGPSTTVSADVAEPEAELGRREELARVAYELIAERGVGGLSLRAAARRVGATTGLLSHHFADRSELVAAALDHAAAVITARTLAAGAPTGRPFEVLAAVLPTDPETVRNWRFALGVRAAAMSDPEFRRYDESMAQLWAGYLPAALEPLVDGDPTEAADFLIAVVDGLALRAAIDPQQWPAERQLNLLCRAFEAVGAASAALPASAPDLP